MSTPINPLSNYTSYSYYHVLCLCDSTDTADALVAQTDSATWDHPPSTTTPLGAYSPKTAPGTSGRYCVLINGSTDATYVITKLTWASVASGGATMEDKNTSIAMEGTMSVSEPRGVMFMNQIVDCCRELGIDSTTAIYVIKTFFVGYTNDGASTVSTVAPLMVLMTDSTGTFTENGGNYTINFVAQSYGAARLPQYSNSSVALSFTAGGTLGETFSILTNSIQRSYDEYYNCIISQLQSAASAAGQDPTPIISAIRKVTYSVQAAPSLSGSEYTVTNQVQQQKDSMGCDQPAKISIPPTMSIEDAIHRIMSMSPRVMSDMNVGDSKTGKKYDYKIHPVVSSSISSTNNGVPVIDYTVTYMVDKFYQPQNISREPATNGVIDPTSNPELAKNTITFDYLYTGKNTDIIDFSIVMNQGLTFIQTATSANSYKSPIDPVLNRTIAMAQPDQNQLVRFGSVAQMPLFFGTQIRNPFHINSLNSNNTIQSAFTMAKQASIETLDAKMTILGNINLLNSVNLTSSPEYTLSRFGSSPSTTGTTQSDVNWGIIPTLAKVNIRMPRNNDDESLFSGTVSTAQDGNTDYTMPFWFDGYYYVYSIHHEFEDGLFKQILSMISMPAAGLEASLGESGNLGATPLTFGDSISGCQDNTINSGSNTKPPSPTSTPTNTVAPPVPAANAPASASTLTHADATTIGSSVTDLSQVTGWNKASPDVKQAIIQAAQTTGINPITLAEIVSIESRFNPTAVPKNKSGEIVGSARGLFQIIRGTWDDTVGSGVPNVPRSTPHSEAFNPYTNALVGAQLEKINISSLSRTLGVPISQVPPGDVYVSHFAGIGGATAIIKGDQASGGRMTMQQAYINYFGQAKGTRLFNNQAEKNSSILNSNTTVGQIRAAAATAMATSVPLATVLAGKKKLPPVKPTITPTQPASPTVSTTANATPTAAVKPTARDRVSATRNPTVDQQAANQNKSSCTKTTPTSNPTPLNTFDPAKLATTKKSGNPDFVAAGVAPSI